MSLTILRSVSGRLATKRHVRDATGAVVTQGYDRERLWQLEIAEIAHFDALVERLNQGLDEPTMLAVRGAPKVGIDISRPIIRKSNGPDATIEDVQQHHLHLDIDCIGAPHLDVVARPEEAQDYALDLIDKAAPELAGAACLLSWSSSAGVYDKTRVKLHAWYWLDEPRTCAELKLWGSHVNARAGCRLFDLALFQPVQPNYIARPLFEGMDDPFPGAARAVVIDGRTPNLVIDKPPLVPVRRYINSLGGRGGCSSRSIEAAIASMGEDADGFHRPWLRAMSCFYAENGPDADPRPLFVKLVRAIKRHGTRDATYIAKELRGMIRRARVLAERERSSRDAIDNVREALSRRTGKGEPDHG
jgi:hypothetical protein